MGCIDQVFHVRHLLAWHKFPLNALLIRENARYIQDNYLRLRETIICDARRHSWDTHQGHSFCQDQKVAKSQEERRRAKGHGSASLRIVTRNDIRLSLANKFCVRPTMIFLVLKLISFAFRLLAISCAILRWCLINVSLWIYISLSSKPIARWITKTNTRIARISHITRMQRLSLLQVLSRSNVIK